MQHRKSMHFVFGLVLAAAAWAGFISPEEMHRRIQAAFLAPAIVGPWQRDVGYALARIISRELRFAL